MGGGRRRPRKARLGVRDVHTFPLRTHSRSCCAPCCCFWRSVAAPASAGKPRPQRPADYTLLLRRPARPHQLLRRRQRLHAVGRLRDGQVRPTPTSWRSPSTTRPRTPTNRGPWTKPSGPTSRTPPLHFTDSASSRFPAYEFWLVADNGELNVYNVPDLPPKQEFLGPDRLPMFMDWLASRPGSRRAVQPPDLRHARVQGLLRTQRHPRRRHGSWLEVFNDVFTESSYVKALDEGWHLMPSANSDTHDANWIWRQRRAHRAARRPR